MVLGKTKNCWGSGGWKILPCAVQSFVKWFDWFMHVNQCHWETFCGFVWIFLLFFLWNVLWFCMNILSFCCQICYSPVSQSALIPNSDWFVGETYLALHFSLCTLDAWACNRLPLLPPVANSPKTLVSHAAAKYFHPGRQRVFSRISTGHSMEG